MTLEQATIDTLGSTIARMNQVGWNECRHAIEQQIYSDEKDLLTNN